MKRLVSTILAVALLLGLGALAVLARRRRYPDAGRGLAGRPRRARGLAGRPRRARRTGRYECTGCRA